MPRITRSKWARRAFQGSAGWPGPVPGTCPGDRPTNGPEEEREGMAATLPEAVALQERLAAGDAPKGRPTRQRFADYAEQWSKLHAGHLAPSTRETYATLATR